MPALTVRNISDQTKQMLRERAAKNARSMEAEVREIIANTLQTPEQTNESSAEKKYLEDVASVRGMWAGRMTTDEVMNLTRGEE